MPIACGERGVDPGARSLLPRPARRVDRKSTRLNSSHLVISYAVFCLKKKKFGNTRLPPDARVSAVQGLLYHANKRQPASYTWFCALTGRSVLLTVQERQVARPNGWP